MIGCDVVLCRFFILMHATKDARKTVQMTMMMKMMKILTQKCFCVCNLQSVNCTFADS